MDAMLLANLAARVGSEDTLWIVGDFAFGPRAKDKEWLANLFARLPGKEKHLVVGNHDGEATQELPWTSICHMAEVPDGGGPNAALNHFPMITWHRARKGALHLFAENPSAYDAVRTLAMAVSDMNEFARAIGAQAVWNHYGGLCTVSCDTGSAFLSTEFQTAVNDLGGHVHFGPVGVPELRATIERTFGTFSTTLASLLPGRTFSDVAERGDYDADARAVLDDEDLELLRIIIRWIVDFYHHAPHSGLQGQTPASRWKELAKDRFVPSPPDRLTRRVHAVICGQFRHGALALQCFQRHASLEARVMVPAFRHVLISSFLQTSRRQIIAFVTVQFSGRCSVRQGRTLTELSGITQTNVRRWF